MMFTICRFVSLCAVCSVSCVCYRIFRRMEIVCAAIKCDTNENQRKYLRNGTINISDLKINFLQSFGKNMTWCGMIWVFRFRATKNVMCLHGNLLKRIALSSFIWNVTFQRWLRWRMSIVQPYMYIFRMVTRVSHIIFSVFGAKILFYETLMMIAGACSKFKRDV